MGELSLQVDDPAAGIRAQISDTEGTVVVDVEHGASADRVVAAIARCVAPHLGRYRLRSMSAGEFGYTMTFEAI